ncbi:transportin-3 isoform X2 [Onthophagus taurus]
MRTKIHQSFHELPFEVHSSLRDSLLDHISKITETTNPIIVTQLSLALADLILQMPIWQKATLDLVNRFSQSHLWPLLEVLIVLPEELEIRSVRLGENRRIEIQADFKCCAPTVNEFLKHCCSNYSTNLHENVHLNVKIIRCFTSWVSVGAIQLEDVSDNSVVAHALNVLCYKQESEKHPPILGALHDAATECLCTLLRCLESNNNQHSLEMFLFNSILNFEVPYHLSVANEDQDKSMNYCRIFTELGESFLDKIVNAPLNQPHFAIKVFDLVLLCVGHHDYEVAEITFNLWYLLSEELYNRKDKTTTELYRPYIERLVTALCRHCQIEPDHEGLLDEGDDFKDFRLKVSDLIKDVVFIVGSCSCFRQMFMNLQVPGVTWESTEAALFVMQAVAKNVLPSENDVVPKVVEAILNVPENTHIAVRHTSVLLLGQLCEWIEKHPETLDMILNFLVYCLPQQGIGAAAATALQSICGTCGDHMPGHIPVLVHLLRQVDTFAITNNAVIGLLTGVAAIVSCMPHRDVTSALRELCYMQLTPLMQLIEQDVVPVRGTKSDPVLWVDRLAAIFKYVTISVEDGEQHPCKPIILEVWPIISKIFDKYQNDIRIMERVCRTMRYMLRCVSQQVREILESLVGQIMRLYLAHKHSCFLYVGSILVDEYATDATCVQGLLEMLQTFLAPTFELLQGENGLRNHPDTVDDFFRLCTRLLQRAALPFLKCTAIDHIIQCAILASTIDHREANITVAKFLCDFVGSSKSSRNQNDFCERSELVKKLLNKYGQQMMTNLIQASVFYLHSYMLSEIGDLVLALCDYDRELASSWLYAALETLPKDGGNGVITVSSQQLNEFHFKVIGSETSKSITHALKDLSRLYR